MHPDAHALRVRIASATGAMKNIKTHIVECEIKNFCYFVHNTFNAYSLLRWHMKPLFVAGSRCRSRWAPSSPLMRAHIAALTHSVDWRVISRRKEAYGVGIWSGIDITIDTINFHMLSSLVVIVAEEIALLGEVFDPESPVKIAAWTAVFLIM